MLVLLCPVSVFEASLIFGRHFIGRKARVEPSDLFIGICLTVARVDVLVGYRRLSSGDIGLAADADAIKKAEGYERRLW